MKRIREYQLKGDFLYCFVSFIDDEDLFPQSSVLKLAARVKPSFNPDSKHSVFQSLSAREMSQVPTFSLDIVVQEMQYFLETLKQMYQL